jgi:outer membrane protein OmpA-like peptidoglycan-associated protein
LPRAGAIALVLTAIAWLLAAGPANAQDRRWRGEPVEATALFDQAEADRRAGRIDEAEAAFEEVIARFPNSSAATQSRDRLIEIFAERRDRRLAGTTPGAEPRKAPPVAGWQSGIGRTQPPPQSTLPPQSGRPDKSAAVPQQPPPPQLRRGGDDFKSAVGDRVFFSESSAALGATERQVVAAQAAWLRQRPDAQITIEGHAQENGPRDLDLAVSRERAEAVKALLVREGVEPQRIVIEALGSSRPVALCDVPAAASTCATHNRRVVTVVTWPETGNARRVGTATGAAREQPAPHSRGMPR